MSLAIEGAHEALALHVSGMIEDGEALPPATAIGSVTPQPDGLEIFCIIPVGVLIPGKPVEVAVKLDDALLSEIDTMSDDRSRFLSDAARAEIARRMAA